MEYIRLRVWFLFAALVVIVVLLFKWAADSRGIYQAESPITDEAITAAYPELYNAVFQRDAREITPFLTHASDTVRQQAWRALASTPIDSTELFIGLAKQQNTEVSWFALSKHSMNVQQLRQLEQLWGQQQALRPGIARVLGRQGDQQSLQFLLSQVDSIHNREYHFALAISRLLMRYEIGEEEQIRLLQQAFTVDADSVRQAYLYGWYRNPQTPLSSTARDTLLSRWRTQGLGIDRTLDQYVNHILPDRTTYRITNFYNSEQELDSKVQLSVELAKSLRPIEMTERRSLAAKILLMHENPQVQLTALQSLAGKFTQGGDLYRYVTETMLENTSISGHIWFQALKVASAVDSTLVGQYKQRMEQYVEENPYLRSYQLGVFQASQSPEEYLKHLREVINQEDHLATMQVVESLQQFWQELPAKEQMPDRIRKIRALTFDALQLHDRGVAYMAKPLLEQEALFQQDDFKQINGTLDGFLLPDDIEVYQQFGQLYKERFEEQARPVIDSLAALGYAPLNQSLADAGWEVDIPKSSGNKFRTPDWQRLWQLGTKPRWTLYTERGAITIRMDPLRAPATVSAIDSLSRAGAYDGVPFHRVVPNFVIQGGDIERQDGFGGPDFILPTESSELEFERGAAGIASAGTDTEGSQYFMMNQWSPHLNGNYTRFGKVIEGMGVVDRMEVGDQVISTTWY
ncbi:peptidylprolyl isomerase [Fodinibius salsisoli]|uniref:peptidylprolyl isomerase n=1 Tax=Fodinibius salsisoli TaxID=2820877 RepID=A0ABT3PIY2_9BACT|nr:peptidylprolyl isomerase [Fodinibius salsisoli]MCW9705881.1 peptidylprolyl isomerase [Fodinibius salsisoli]